MATPRSSQEHKIEPKHPGTDGLDLFTIAMIVIALGASVALLVWALR